MQDKIELLKKKIADAIKDVHSSDSLFQIKMKYLGKSGEVSELMKGMRDVPKDKRRMRTTELVGTEAGDDDYHDTADLEDEELD